MTHALVATPQELKARGAFYTPPELTAFLARWAVRTADDRALEPSCGDGAFVSALVSRYREFGVAKLDDRVLGVERDAREAAKARAIAPYADIRPIDFFEVEPSSISSVDAVIGNPPYIRYHAFNGADRDRALARARDQGVELTRLASSWAHFVIHSAAFLKPEGRMALVLPAELLHTDYGQPVRQFLLRRFSSVLVIAFDRMIFRDAQVDAVLLLASSDDCAGLRIIRVADEQALAAVSLDTPDSDAGYAPSRWSASIDAEAEGIYRGALDRYAHQRLGTFAHVDIGFVSGGNDFFVLDDAQVKRWRLPRHVLTPAVRRPSDVPGLEVRADELRWLLDLNGPEELAPEVQAYLAHGEATGIAERYKCRVRRAWYAVPLSKRRPDLFLPYMQHRGPRLIVNTASSRSTNLLHGVALAEGHAPASLRALAVAAASSLTLLSAEVEGRAYGGGVLKLETREAERLILPRISEDLSRRLEAAFEITDRRIRNGELRSATREVDAILGLDHERLWSALLVYQNRRLGRRARAAERKTSEPLQDVGLQD